VIFTDPVEQHEGRQFFSGVSLIAGGFGINAARSLKCWGESPHCILLSGGKTGEMLLSCLNTESLTFTNVETSLDTRIAATRVAKQQTRMSVSPSPIQKDECIKEAFAKALEISSPTDTILVGGSSAPANESIYLELVRNISVSRRCYCDIRTSNVSALITLRSFALKLPAIRGTRRISRKLIEPLLRAVYEGARIAIQSIEPRSLLIATKEGLFYGSAPKLETINLFGAGDCLIATLAYFLDHGHDPAVSLRRAMAAATASVLSTIPGHFDPHYACALEKEILIRETDPSNLPWN
jgi:fructose-1-phosphate kinase PfkB-like protein